MEYFQVLHLPMIPLLLCRTHDTHFWGRALTLSSSGCPILTTLGLTQLSLRESASYFAGGSQIILSLWHSKLAIQGPVASACSPCRGSPYLPCPIASHPYHLKTHATSVSFACTIKGPVSIVCSPCRGSTRLLYCPAHHSYHWEIHALRSYAFL